jgi:hypothetical protein
LGDGRKPEEVNQLIDQWMKKVLSKSAASSLLSGSYFLF